jgi:hypothetical protein
VGCPVVVTWGRLLVAHHPARRSRCSPPARRSRCSPPDRAVCARHVALVLVACPHVVVASNGCRSTCNLPHEQLLMRLEVGGMSSVVVVGLGAVVLVACWRWRSSSRVACPAITPPVPPHEQVAHGSGGVCCRRQCRSTRDPPHEQSLVRLEWVVGCPGVLMLSNAIIGS